MAKKQSTMYVCTSCSAQFPKWSGKCSTCGEWNTLVEQSQGGGSQRVSAGSVLRPSSGDEPSQQASRLQSGLSELDELLGGGVVSASSILIAGQPGIGKSTLLMQLSASAAKQYSVLYISAEESAAQVQLRAKRLLNDLPDNLHITSSNNANDCIATMQTGEYDIVIVDSIQTVSLQEVQSAPGSVSQITNSTHELIAAAKASNTAIILVGHVTKEGSIAGPKLLEHIVDVVLHFEGEPLSGFKVLRAVKNRFGSTNASILYDMHTDGLKVVENASELLLAERQVSDGSVVLAAMDGNRAQLVEVQALVSPTSFGYPKRSASGFELNRLTVLIAMLSQRTKLKLDDKDIYINIIGGIKITDPAADLAICMAIASAAKKKLLPEDSVVFGEVGLSGEVRRVQYVDRRNDEAVKLGYKTVIGPKLSARSSVSNKNYVAVSSIGAALQNLID